MSGKQSQLSRRERQIMDTIYAKGQATAMEVLKNLPDPPSYSAVRALLRILEDKGHLRHKKKGMKYVYIPIQSRRQASKSAIHRLIHTFFDGSIEKTVAALLNTSDYKLTPEELDRLSKMIQNAKK